MAGSIWSSLFALAALGASCFVGGCSATSSSSGSGGGAATAGTGGSGGSGNAGGSGGTIALGGSGGAAGSAAGGTGGVCDQAVDIVFVMDVSTSMDQFLNKLAADLPTVDQAVKKLNLNAPPHYGLVVFVDDFTFLNLGQPYTDISSLQKDFQTWAAFTSTNQQTKGGGTNTTWPENSLDALYAAATQFPWRPDQTTLRMVIHTTDDTFEEGPMTTVDGVSIIHDYSGTLATLEAGKVRVFSFAAKLGGPTESDDVSMGWFGPYNGKPAIPTATGGAVYLLDDVYNNTINLGTAIPAAVKDSQCKPYPQPS